MHGGFTVDINKGLKINNQWTVPYNPVLSRTTFMVHINVELFHSVRSYICKYVNKGSNDQVAFGIENKCNEVSKYEAGRYISSSEALWRILCFPIHERFLPVMYLSVHLENGQRVYFTADAAAEKVRNPPKTTLLAFFDLKSSVQRSSSILYVE